MNQLNHYNQETMDTNGKNNTIMQAVIRFCKAEETIKLQTFIDTFWRKDHILSRNEELLDFQHYNRIDKQYNFVVAADPDTDEFMAILGFIPTWQYDQKQYEFIMKRDLLPVELRGPELTPELTIELYGANSRHIWLAIWKKDDANEKTKGLGQKLLDFLIDAYKPHTIAAIGINDQVRKLYEKMGFETGELSHYVRLNHGKVTQRIARLNTSEFTMEHIESSDIYDEVIKAQIDHFPQNYMPEKSQRYIVNRYVIHETYRYNFFGIYKNGIMKALFVVRICEALDGKCMRIVDMIGDLDIIQSSLSNDLDYWMNIFNCEYIDCINQGLSKYWFNTLGFSLAHYTGMIIPNYFEPFVQRNITLKYSVKRFDAPDKKYIIFKGDSDQDRPNEY